MKRIAALFLALTLLSSLYSCGTSKLSSPESTAQTEEKKTEVVKPVQKPQKEETKEEIFLYPTVVDPLTAEKLAAIPIANSSMSVTQLRQICLDYFYLQLTFGWTPDSVYKYIIESSGKNVTINRGTVYGGIPYVTVGTGNLYRILEYYDTETGVLKTSTQKADPKLFGNQCSVGAFWGWGRVINSANYDWTQNMVLSRGFIPVGPYTYPEDLVRYAGTDEGAMTTTDICNANGRDVMYESYALLQPADGMVTFKTAGHTRMVSIAPEVIRKDDGTIDGDKSFLHYRDQTSSWHTEKQSDGSSITIQGGVDSKVSFQKLFASGYLPFTFAEFQGTDPVEKSTAALSVTGENLSVEELKNAVLTTNYAISDVFLKVYDTEGTEVYSYVKRSTKASVMSVEMKNVVYPNSVNAFCDGNHRVEISVQLSTGEKHTVYNGLLTN